MYVHVFLELNVIDTNYFFFSERRGQSDLVAPYNRDQIGSTITKMGVITAEPYYHAEPSYLGMGVPPLPHERSLYF